MANAVNIRKWVDALQSGEFEQGMGRLAHNGKFCCLGVACEVAIRDGLELNREPDPQGTNYCDCESCKERYADMQWYDGQCTFLPKSVQSWLGIEQENPILATYRDGSFMLAELNDNGKTFPEIADLIETEWLTEEVAA